MNIKIVYIGILDGLETWEVYDEETGEKIGMNQSLPEIPTP